MSNPTNTILAEEINELREEAGLAYGGVDNLGRTLWIGTDKQWREYARLYKQRGLNKFEELI